MADTRSWAGVPLLADPPPADLPEGQTFRHDGADYWECGFTGWHLMLAWLTGPATLIRSRDNREHYWDVSRQRRDGPFGAWPEPETFRQAMPPEDRREIEDDASNYLREAGLPADRPLGFRWFQRLAPGRTVADIFALAAEAEDRGRGTARRVAPEQARSVDPGGAGGSVTQGAVQSPGVGGGAR